MSINSLASSACGGASSPLASAAADAAAKGTEFDRASVADAMDTCTALYGFYKLMILTDTKCNVLAVNGKDPKGKPIDAKPLYAKKFADSSWFKSVMAGRYLEGHNEFTGTIVEQPQAIAKVAQVNGDDGFSIPIAATPQSSANTTSSSTTRPQPRRP